MNLIFTGLRRTVYEHEHRVTPGEFGIGRPGDPMEWKYSLTTYGCVQGLALSGDFRIEFAFEESELRNWLKKYVEEQPDKALELVAEMQVKAIIQLAKSE